MKVINWIAKKRLLDGYIGILGVILWYRILADYTSVISIFDLSMRIWKTSIFNVSIEYHNRNTKNSTFSHYPPFTLRMVIHKWIIVDMTKGPAAKTSADVAGYMAKREASRLEEARLIEAAREAGL